MDLKLKLRLIALVILIGIFAVLYADDVPQEETIPEAVPKSFLKTSRRNIVDGKGNAIILRGVNLGGWLVPEGYILKFEGKYDRPRTIDGLIVDLIGEEKAKEFWSAYRKKYIAEKDIETIASLGFNHVRVPFHYNLFISEDDPGAWKEDGFEILDDLINWCSEYGLYVILDMHCAPGGQTGANIDDSIDDQPDLWTSDLNKQKTVDVWRKIAERYKDNTTVIGYDLLNEPIASKFPKYDNEKDLIPLYKAIVSAIREVDSNHIIFLEGSNWGNNFKKFPEPFDSNVVYSFHKYWDKTDKNSIKDYLRLAEKHNVPLWCGETGENNNQWYYACMQLFEDYNIGWSFWAWKKVESESGIYSIKKPAGYDAIIHYTKSGSKKPAVKQPQETLDEFIDNLSIENCRYNPKVVQGLLKTIPMTVETEDFGYLGEGVSYHDAGKTNEGKSYRRSEGVDVEISSYNVGWTESGEWLKYDIYSPADKKYNIEFRVASAVDESQFRLEIDDKDVTGPMTVENTGGWSEWKIITREGIEISKGRHKVRLYVIKGGFNIDWFRFK
ncbi:MAG: cellulase family glycosylhydrolase [Candidatus Omnitrophota bacterium]|nr:cellulase family glycosylhydrolase [Candidatus Omnitrophota bacterium]